MTNATYTKLRDGSWGIRVEGEKPVVGQVIIVRKKSGETRNETVKAVLWSGDGVNLCSIKSGDSETARKPAGREMCAECGQRPGVRMCRDSSGIVGMCCSRCAALPPYKRSFA